MEPNATPDPKPPSADLAAEMGRIATALEQLSARPAPARSEKARRWVELLVKWVGIPALVIGAYRPVEQCWHELMLARQQRLVAAARSEYADELLHGARYARAAQIVAETGKEPLEGTSGYAAIVFARAECAVHDKVGLDGAEDSLEVLWRVTDGATRRRAQILLARLHLEHGDTVSAKAVLHAVPVQMVEGSREAPAYQYARGRCRELRGAYGPALEAYKQGIAAAQRLKDGEALAEGRLLRARLLFQARHVAGNEETARALYEQVRLSGPPRQAVYARIGLSTMACESGDLNEAERLARANLRLFAGAHDELAEAETYLQLGRIAQNRGLALPRQRAKCLDTAMAHYEHAARLAQSRNADFLYLRVAKMQAQLHKDLGHLDQAMELAETVISVAQEKGFPMLESNGCHELGAARQEMGDYAGAVAAYERSIDLSKPLGDLTVQANTYFRWGETELLRGCREDGKAYLEECWRLAKGNRRLRDRVSALAGRQKPPLVLTIPGAAAPRR